MTYNLSKDYEKLYNLLCDGHVIACFVDYSFRNEDIPVSRDICKGKRFKAYDIHFSSRGIQYGGIDTWWEDKGPEKVIMIKECERMNLEFIPI